MDRTLVLHVGLPKCGSTSLQDAMAASAEVLSLHGVRFVRLRPTKIINTIASGRGDHLWPRVLGDDQPDLVILSSEYLCTLTRGGIDGLLRGIAGEFTGVRVVFVLRLLEDWVLSRMNQRALGLPGSADVDQDADPLSVEVGLDVGEPDEWIATWADWIAEDAASRELTLLPLLGSTPLPVRFLAAVGRSDILLDADTAQIWTNRSVDDRAVDLIETTRALAELLRERQGLTSIRDDAAAFDLIKQIISLAKQWERPSGAAPSPRSLRAASKVANAIRDRLDDRVADPLRSEVLDIIGTRETARRERKRRARGVASEAAEGGLSPPVPLPGPSVL